MKKNCLLVLFLSLSFFVQAQITEEMRSKTSGVHNALVLELPDANLRLVKKWWAAYMKDYDARTKKVKGGDEMYSAGAGIVAIGGSAGVDVYSRLDQSGTAVTNTVWFDLGGEEGFVASDKDNSQYIEAEKFLMRFALYVTKEKVKIELAEDEKEMRTLQNELEKLQRSKVAYEREIEQAKERIKRAEENLVKNAEEQEETKRNIELQGEVLKEVKKRLSEL